MKLHSEDKWYAGLIIFSLLLASFYYLSNRFGQHYPWVSYTPLPWLKASPLLAALFVLANYAESHSPKMAWITKTYTRYFFIMLTLSILTNGLQTTPFPVIDNKLVAFDEAMGIHTPQLLAFFNHHFLGLYLLNYAYESLGIQLFFVPIIMALYNEKKSVTIYLFALIFSYLVGTTLYYFFPTKSPSALFHSPFFTFAQQITAIKFFDVHQHIRLNTNQGGMIAFPSFHVIWAVLVTYVAHQKRWLFCLLCGLNTVLIASTILLGWHYALDVVAGFICAGLALQLATELEARYLTTRKCERPPLLGAVEEEPPPLSSSSV